MKEVDRLSQRDEAIEYGRHVFGVLPDGTVTGLLAHKGEYWESYVESGKWSRFQDWEQDYQNTPLGEALESFVEGEEMWTTHTAYNGEEYQRRQLVSGTFSNWRFEYERKRAFQKAVLRGDVRLPTPAIFNRYGDCFIEEGSTDYLEERYWEFVDANYEHRQSHQAVTKS